LARGHAGYLIEAHGARLVVERLAVSNANELGGFLYRILKGHVRIDVVVNNAGYSAMGAAELSDDQIRWPSSGSVA
jgi:NAD(P)-dependent dehydrogenase (short-subunit alcohol dehydrogenase family)